MYNVVIDLETLSTKHNPVILSIGAVKLRGREIVSKYIATIDIQSCLDVGLQIDGDTLKWWFKQSKEAREVFENGISSLPAALEAFAAWLRKDDYYIWGYPATSDNIWLESAYDACKLERPWPFWANRCLATLSKEYPEIVCKEPEIAHNALHDAEVQAQYLLDLLANSQNDYGI